MVVSLMTCSPGDIHAGRGPLDGERGVRGARRVVYRCRPGAADGGVTPTAGSRSRWRVFSASTSARRARRSCWSSPTAGGGLGRAAARHGASAAGLGGADAGARLVGRRGGRLPGAAGGRPGDVAGVGVAALGPCLVVGGSDGVPLRPRSCTASTPAPGVRSRSWTSGWAPPRCWPAADRRSPARRSAPSWPGSGAGAGRVAARAPLLHGRLVAGPSASPASTCWTTTRPANAGRSTTCTTTPGSRTGWRQVAPGVALPRLVWAHEALGG